MMVHVKRHYLYLIFAFISLLVTTLLIMWTRKEMELVKSSSIAIDTIHVMFIFFNAERQHILQSQFKNCSQSMLTQTDGTGLHIHILGDEGSFIIAQDILRAQNYQGQLSHLDSELIYKKFGLFTDFFAQTLSNRQHNFSQSVFFASIIMHLILPKLQRIILLDIDILFLSDIYHLYSHYENFTHNNVIGIAAENQPVYRNALWQYREENPGTQIAEPLPHGRPGLNSGVLLLDLAKMRQIQQYSKFVFDKDYLQQIVKKYKFVGSLGDQDFYSLLYWEQESLFYILPCGWNKQLCQYWNRDEYVKVFPKYFDCHKPIHILHGNCRSDIQNFVGKDHLVS